MEDSELAFIKEKVLSFLSNYSVYNTAKRRSPLLTLKKELSFLKPKYNIKLHETGEAIEVSGGIFEHEFKISKKGTVVATVSKKVFSWTDEDSVDIVEGEDPVLMLCICTMIDQIEH